MKQENRKTGKGVAVCAKDCLVKQWRSQRWVQRHRKPPAVGQGLPISVSARSSEREGSLEVRSRKRVQLNGLEFWASQAMVNSLRWCYARFGPLLLLAACGAYAEDIRMTDGTVFRNAHVVEVRPDALVVSHERGMVLADLAKLPKALRSRYGYDPDKAAEYREREAKLRDAKVEEDQRLLAALEIRRMEQARLQMEASQGTAAGGMGTGDATIAYRAGSADRAREAALRSVVTEMSRQIQLKEAAERPPDSFWTMSFWKSPIVKMLGGLLGAGGGGSAGSEPSASEPRNWR